MMSALDNAVKSTIQYSEFKMNCNLTLGGRHSSNGPAASAFLPVLHYAYYKTAVKSKSIITT